MARLFGSLNIFALMFSIPPVQYDYQIGEFEEKEAAMTCLIAHPGVPGPIIPRRFISGLLLFAILEVSGNLLAILFLLLMQPPSIEEIPVAFRVIPEIIRDIVLCTVLPTAIYAWLMTCLGLHADPTKDGAHLGKISAALAVGMAFAAFPLAAYLLGEWNALLHALEFEPLMVVFLLGMVSTVAACAGVVSSLIAKRLFEKLGPSSAR